MTFDMNLAVMSTAVGLPDLDKLPPGQEASVELVLTVPITLPFASSPDGDPLSIPIGNVRFRMGRDDAVDFFRNALTAAERLPRKSDVLIANSMSDVDRAHDTLKRVTGQ